MLGGRGEEGETEYTLRTAVAVQTDRWAKAYGSGEGRLWRVWDELKGLPLLGMQGTSRLKSEHLEKKEQLRDWLNS